MQSHLTAEHEVVQCLDSSHFDGPTCQEQDDEVGVLKGNGGNVPALDFEMVGPALEGDVPDD